MRQSSKRGALAQHPRGGLSLLELMLTLFIVALAVAMGFSVAGGTRGHMSVQQVAQELLADLRWARQQAMTRGVPAGVLLPQAAAGQGYDVVSADVDEPGAIRVVRAEDWSADGRYAVLAVGTWSGLPFQPADPPFNGRQDPSTQTLLAQCARTWPGRYVMFGPNGTAVTSGVPNANGEHYLVVTAGLRESGGSMNAIWAPAATVRVSTEGYAATVDGVPSFPALQEGPAPVPTLGSLPPGLPVGPRLYPKPYARPAIVSLDVLPTANANALPPGAVAGSTYTLAPNGRMSLSVTAQDPNGDALYCDWYSAAVPGVPANTAPMPPSNSTYDAPAGGGATGIGGTFSVTGIQPMARSTSTARQWTDAVEWSPPPGAIPGEWFELGVVIDDLRGGKDARWIVVGIADSGHVVCNMYDPGGTRQAFAMQTDGTNPVQLTRGPLHDHGTPSPDGTHVAYYRNSGGQLGVYELFVANLDGSGERKLATGVKYVACPCWSPDGTSLFFAGSPTAVLGFHSLIQSGLYRMRADGSQTAVQLTAPGGVLCDMMPAVSPDGRTLAFVSSRSGDLHVFLCDADGSNVRDIIDPSLIDRSRNLIEFQSPAWSGDGSFLLFSRTTDASPYADLFICRADGTGARLFPAPPCNWGGSWSPDGRWLLTQSNRDYGGTSNLANYGGASQWDVYRMSADGRVQMRLTRSGTASRPLWSR